MSECTRLLQSILYMQRPSQLLEKNLISSLRQNNIIFHNSPKLQNNETSKTRLDGVYSSFVTECRFESRRHENAFSNVFQMCTFVKGKLLISRVFLSPDHFKILLWFQMTCTLYDTFIGDGIITFPHLLLSAIYILIRAECRNMVCKQCIVSTILLRLVFKYYEKYIIFL